MTGTADVLVIGGGIAGISAAARLAPDARVTVLEREPAIGTHATGRSAAIFIANYGNATLRALNAASAPALEVPDFVDGPLLSPRGELLVATEAEMPALERHLAGAEGMEALSPDEAVALVPVLRGDLISGAAIERGARDIDVDRLLQGFARQLRHHRGTVVQDAGAERIGRGGGVWRVETAAGEFEAPVLVNAAGAWADTVAEMAGVARVGLVPMRRSAAILPAPAGHDVDRWPLFAPVSESWYAKPEAGKLMVSPADEDPVDPHDAWPDDMVLAEGLDRFERMTTVEVTRVERSWAGLRSFVADRSPAVGFAADAEGFFWLAGQGGYGVQTSPALSRLAADLVLARKPALPAAVVAALDPGRAGIGPAYAKS
ncbi:MAG: FAD-binding oxidoreductase [Thalassobaculum sp.]|uniref:NAD(P)/FAD-dependent oxidoreductase n=1 Tax=Thalassobaculum sp. TaxID=2022740 RepID=UPI0032EC097A